MNKIKKIFKWVGIVLLAFLLVLILFPFVFKDKIINAVKTSLNNELQAKVEFSDIDLSVWRSFPEVNVGINNLTIRGKDTFEDVLLLSTDRVDIDFTIYSLISKSEPPSIKYIGFQNPEINIVTWNDSTANYLITKPSTDTTTVNYRLILDSYDISNGSLEYTDHERRLKLNMKDIHHSGKGDFTQDIFDLTTKTNATGMNLEFGGISYITNATLKGDVNLNMNVKENVFTLKDNKLTLNELEVKGEGYLKFLENDAMEINFKANTANESFKSFLSVIPFAYTNDFKNVETRGNASINAIVNGIYSDTPAAYPAFDVKVKIQDGYFKYPGVKQAVSAVNAEINVAASKPDYKDMKVDIPNFRMMVDKEFINGNLHAGNLSGDQRLEGKIHADIKLENLIAAFPVQDIEKLSGYINADMSFKAKMSDVNNENYSAIDFKGKADVANLYYKSKNLPAISVKSAGATMTPQSLQIISQEMMLGKSDLKIQAKISNPLAAFSTEKSTFTEINASSNLLDLNEWSTESNVNPSNNPTPPVSAQSPNELMKKAKISLNTNFNKVLFGEYQIEKINLKGDASANLIRIENMSGLMDGNDFAVKGVVANAYDYLINNEILDGELTFTSRKFDLNKYMVNENSGDRASEGVIPVPENIRLNIKADIGELVYTNLNLRNFSGTLEIQNQEMALRNMQTDVLGGKIEMEGVYNTTDLARPGFEFRLDLQKIKYAEAVNKLTSFSQLAPIASYLEGIFNTTLVMKGHLGTNMIPELSTLDASGFIETLSGKLKGFKPLNDVADKLGLNALKDFNLDNTKNWFDIAQGYLELKKFSRNIAGIDMDIAGRHGFGKEMDFNIRMAIPREMLKDNKLTSQLEKGLSFLEKEASKIGVNIAQGNTINLLVKLGGKIQQPTIKITPLSSQGEGTLQEGIKGEISDRISDIKDDVKSELKEKENEIRDSLSRLAESEISKIKTQAEDAANKAADSLRNKVGDVISQKLDTLTKGVLADSLKQKAKDVLGDKTGEEVDKIKDKLKDFNPFKKKGGG
ncbi:MAG: hypothetical protein IPM42_02590 [Saprospiraceae bacterium]|nr:hypothetical protein [Saprospiraceae bacterium]